jgi:hypothetical protein
MKKSILLFGILFISNFLYSQEYKSSDLDKLNIIKGRIEKSIMKLSDSLSIVKSQIEEFEKQKILLKISQYKDSIFILGIASIEVPLRDAPNPEGTSILIIKRGEKIRLYEYMVGKGYWYSSAHSSFGYVSDAFIYQGDSVKWYKDIFYTRNLNQEKLIQIEKIKKEKILQVEKNRADSIRHKNEIKAQIQKEREKRDALIKKYGEVNGSKIYQQKIWIGMTRQMLLESWGKPDDINRTVGGFGVHEQFVYGDKYVYVEDGEVTSWQD